MLTAWCRGCGLGWPGLGEVKSARLDRGRGAQTAERIADDLAIAFGHIRLDDRIDNGFAIEVHQTVALCIIQPLVRPR